MKLSEFLNKGRLLLEAHGDLEVVGVDEIGENYEIALYVRSHPHDLDFKEKVVMVEDSN